MIEGLLRSLAPAPDVRTMALSVGGFDGERLSVLDAVTLQMRTPVWLVGRQGSAVPSLPTGRPSPSATSTGRSPCLTWPPAATVEAGGRRWLTRLAFSPDGRTLAVGHDDGYATVDLWDLPSLRLRHTVTGPFSDKTFQMAFSPDGRTLATTFGEAAPAPSRLARSARWFLPPGSFTPSGPIAGAGVPSSSGTSPRESASPRSPRGLEWLTTLAFSPDGRTLAAASHDDGVLIWDTPEPVLSDSRL